LLFFQKKKERDMTGQITSFHSVYRFENNFFQDFQCKSGFIPQIDPAPPPSAPPPVRSIFISKEHQRRRVFDRILQRFSTQEFPGSEHAVSYMRYIFRRNCKQSTLKNSDTGIRFFLTMLKKAGRELAAVTKGDIEAFVEHEQDRGVGINGVRSRLHVVYGFIGYLVENQVVEPDILTRKIKLKLPVPLPRAIDPEDIKELLSVIDHIRNRAMILMLLRTGMRIGELLDLQQADINLPEKKVLIITGEKNSRGRVVYLSEDAEGALRAWLEVRDPRKEMLFYACNRDTMTYAAARKMFKQYLNKAGLSFKGYTLHQLRHTFASEMLNAGLRLEVLQQLLGHSSLEVTRQYARLTDKTREKEYFHAMTIIERGEIHGHY
jgi:integrase/recombinase XerD